MPINQEMLKTAQQVFTKAAVSPEYIAPLAGAALGGGAGALAGGKNKMRNALLGALAGGGAGAATEYFAPGVGLGLKYLTQDKITDPAYRGILSAMGGTPSIKTEVGNVVDRLGRIPESIQYGARRQSDLPGLQFLMGANKSGSVKQSADEWQRVDLAKNPINWSRMLPKADASAKNWGPMQQGRPAAPAAGAPPMAPVNAPPMQPIKRAAHDDTVKQAISVDDVMNAGGAGLIGGGVGAGLGGLAGAAMGGKGNRLRGALRGAATGGLIGGGAGIGHYLLGRPNGGEMSNAVLTQEYLKERLDRALPNNGGPNVGYSPDISNLKDDLIYRHGPVNALHDLADERANTGLLGGGIVGALLANGLVPKKNQPKNKPETEKEDEKSAKAGMTKAQSAKSAAYPNLPATGQNAAPAPNPMAAVNAERVRQMKAMRAQVQAASGTPNPVGNGVHQYSGRVMPGGQVQNAQYSHTPAPAPQATGMTKTQSARSFGAKYAAGLDLSGLQKYLPGAGVGAGAGALVGGLGGLMFPGKRRGRLGGALSGALAGAGLGGLAGGAAGGGAFGQGAQTAMADVYKRLGDLYNQANPVVARSRTELPAQDIDPSMAVGQA